MQLLTILGVCICVFLAVCMALLFRLLRKKQADPTPALREELRFVRQEQQSNQSEMRRELQSQLTGLNRLSLETMSHISEPRPCKT